ncbi:mRNA export factor-like [Penaeus indicus]|uniref:mRNA export factor-like n=1 Tax=Penaeus indicus TaxID=29960 RepID=UPI00300C1064
MACFSAEVPQLCLSNRGDLVLKRLKISFICSIIFYFFFYLFSLFCFFQHRCVAIFKDKKGSGAPAGFALGSVEGRVAIQYIVAASPRDNFTFKCHRSNGTSNGFQDIYAVNDIKFHPVHGTLATVGSDGRFSFWDKDARTKLKNSEAMEQPISSCAFNHNGQIFAYAVSYDWSKGHEFFNPQKKNYIFLRSCYDDLKPRNR